MRTFAFTALVLAVGACQTPLEPESAVSGTYVLESVRGHPVPYAMSDDPAISISGRIVALTPHGSFTDRVELSISDQVESQRFAVERQGTFSSKGAEVTLTYTDGHASRATVSDGKLTLDDRGLIFVLRR